MKKIMVCLFLFCSALYAREIQILPPNVIDVEEETIALVERCVLSVLDSMGYEVEEDSDLSLRMVMMRLGNSYLLNFEVTRNGEVLKSKREKFVSLKNIEVIVTDLFGEILYSQTEYDEDERSGTASESSNAETNKKKPFPAEFNDGEVTVGSVLATIVFGLAYTLSDYIALEFFLGGVNASPLPNEAPYTSKDYKWGAQLRASFIFGFSDYHSWGLVWGFAKEPSEKTNAQFSFLSTHRFSQKEGLFFDFVWGAGTYWYDVPLLNKEVTKGGWLIGANLGYNIIHSKNHWLSLALGYEHMINDAGDEGNVVSINLVYAFRGYFE